MAVLLAKLRTQYPHVAEAVADLALIQARKPKVFQAFCQWSGLSPHRARAAMVLGALFVPGMVGKAGPEVDVVSLVANPNRRDAYAHYPGIGHVIQLDKIFADQFEKLVTCDPIGRDPHGRFLEERESGVLLDEQRAARLLMESKLLHEMVHWARTMISLLPDPRTPDRGWDFEEAAYPKGIQDPTGGLTATSLGLRTYINLPNLK